MNERNTDRGTFAFSDLEAFGARECGALAVRESFSLTLDASASTAPLRVSALAKFDGTDAPVIEFSLITPEADGAERLYRSPSYTVGTAKEYVRREWRVPPAFLPGMHTVVTVTVPEGTTLYLRQMNGAPDAALPAWNGGVRHNAHLGFIGLAPGCTLPACELAAACGFPACIVVPKVTADGVLVFIHDDTINRTGRDADGNAPAEPMKVSEMTYEELLAWDFGIAKNRIYAGTRIPLLEDFFSLCAKTGMRPMFSTHPALTVGQWEQVKKMLARRGLLPLFHIKSFSLDVLETAYSVFGDEIDGYTWDDGDAEKFKASALADACCRLGIEHRRTAITAESVAAIREAGFFAAAWNVGRIPSDEYRRLIALGVTEFTEDYHCSMGLNW